MDKYKGEFDDIQNLSEPLGPPLDPPLLKYYKELKRTGTCIGTQTFMIKMFVLAVLLQKEAGGTF